VGLAGTSIFRLVCSRAVSDSDSDSTMRRRSDPGAGRRPEGDLWSVRPEQRPLRASTSWVVTRTCFAGAQQAPLSTTVDVRLLGKGRRSGRARNLAQRRSSAPQRLEPAQRAGDGVRQAHGQEVGVQDRAEDSNGSTMRR